jgi:hypothetical protein
VWCDSARRGGRRGGGLGCGRGRGSAIANEEEIPYFSITKEPGDELLMSRNEMERFGLQNSVFNYLNLYCEAYFSFDNYITFKESPKQESKFQEYLIQQAFLYIHGQPFSEEWEGKSFESYINGQLKLTKPPVKTVHSDFDDDIL